MTPTRPRALPAREMHLAVELPGLPLPSPAAGGPLPDFGSYVHLARTAERGLFDFVLITDGPARPGDGRAGGDEGDGGTGNGGGAVCRPDPFTVLDALAAVTERIGLAAAVSTAGRDPVELACRVVALDRLSAGRAAGPAPAAVALPPPGFPAPPGHLPRPVTIATPVPAVPRPPGMAALAGAAEAAVADKATRTAAAGNTVPETAAEVVVLNGPAPRTRPGAKLLARIDFALGAWPAAGPADPLLLAERLAARVRSGELDGYVLTPDPIPGGRGLDVFVDRVVPLLQARGALRTAYRGSTLRDHLRLPVSVPPTIV